MTEIIETIRRIGDQVVRDIATIKRDPALARMLDRLPRHDPDAEPAKPAEPDRIEIWVAFCEGRVVVPAGAHVDVRLGHWHGPKLPTEEIVLHLRNLRTNAETQSALKVLRGKTITDPGDVIFVSGVFSV